MRKFGMLAMALLGAGLIACKKDLTNKTTSEVITKGKWRVSYFLDDNTDKTTFLDGYEFTFANGVITATNGTNTVTGVYSDGVDDGHQEFNIVFSTAQPAFGEMSEDWHVVQKTNTLIQLSDDDDQELDDDVLHFTKL